MIDVPPVVRNKAAEVGADDWLSELPELVADLARRWRLAVGSPFGDATEALVLAVTGEDGTEAVLKLLVPRPGGARTAVAEAIVLRLAAGRGCAALLDADETRGALLLERLGPSLYDLDLPIGIRHEILCRTASRLWMPAPDSGLMTGAEKGRWLIDNVIESWERLDRPCSARALDHAVACATRRIAAHDDERSVLVHGDVHQWNVLRARPESGRAGYKLIDPDGLLAERAYDLGIIMREDPVELLQGEPMDRARHLGRRCNVDARAIWEWGVIERVSTGLLATAIDLQPVGREMLEAADRVVEPG